MDQLTKPLTEHTLEELQSLRTESHSAFQTLVELESPTVAQVDEAEALAERIEQVDAEIARHESAPDRFAALKGKFTTTPEEQPEDGDEDEGEESTEDGDEEAEASSESEPAEGDDDADESGSEQRSTKARGKGVATLASKTKRPQRPARSNDMVSITAAADVPDFSLGQTMGGLDELGQAMVNRMKGFSTPSGDGSHENLQHYGVASIRLPFDNEFVIDRGTDDMEVLEHAANEHRLDGNSLTAAGGWCAPSEILYDLTGDETTEGMLSLPEVNVKRGGIRYTFGPEFADFYANAGFIQTEAQAIAGTTKPCVTIDCPPFVESRLDAKGLCIKAPLLTLSAYPELIQRYISGTMVGHQHMINANVIGRLVTNAGAARVITGLGATATDTLNGLELLAEQTRQRYRLGLSASLEVILPFWVRSAVRADLSNRTGQPLEAVSDEQINAHFAARKLAVQWVYDWQDLPLTDVVGPPAVDAEAYPATFDALMYPAGTFVKGVSDVISLNAVYDAASLAENVYTAMFMEQGLLVAHMKHRADLIRLPVCNAGRTGANDLTCA